MFENKHSVMIRGGLATAILIALSLPAYAEEAAQTFETPQLAAEAFLAATKANDDAALKKLVGDAVGDLVQDGKDPTVAADRAHFVKLAAEALNCEVLEEGVVEITVGNDRWPLPIPLVKGDAGWSFDAESGRDEIISRRVGANELEVIALCRDYVAAQVAYAALDRDADGVVEYAQKLKSEPGKTDGLYWESENDDSPLAGVVTPLEEHGAGSGVEAPFNGYYWRVLTSQGEKAPGGAYSYIINGNMIAGFALVAVPAEYGLTGVMTFMVSNQGKILEKDLGEKSLEIAKAMTAFDPDETWTATEIKD